VPYIGTGVLCDELVNLTFDDVIDLPMPKNGIRTCLQLTGKGDMVRTIPLKPVLSNHYQPWKSIAYFLMYPVLHTCLSMANVRVRANIKIACVAKYQVIPLEASKTSGMLHLPYKGRK